MKTVLEMQAEEKKSLPQIVNNCMNCGSDNIMVVSGASIGVKCMACYKIKVQCCDSKKEAIELWNKLTIKGKNDK